jgi:hypothetical protein
MEKNLHKQTDISDITDTTSENERRETQLMARAREVVIEFRAQRAQQGVQAGDRLWVTPLLIAWEDSLGNSGGSLDDDELIRLGVAMGETLAIRDAVIISLAGNTTVSQLVEVACNPFSQSAHRIMVANFSSVFHSPTFVPTVKRCRTIIELLQRMNTLLPAAYTVQPYAVIGYLYWWMGNMRAARSAIRDALEIDAQCMFAVILRRTLENHVLPAWLLLNKQNTGRKKQE